MAPQIRSVLHGSKTFSQNPAGRTGEISTSQNRLKQNNRIDSFREDRKVSLNSGAAESGKTPIERKQRSISESFRNILSSKRKGGNLRINSRLLTRGGVAKNRLFISYFKNSKSSKFQSKANIGTRLKPNASKKTQQTDYLTLHFRKRTTQNAGKAVESSVARSIDIII